jgi:hypothetical protein
VLKKETKEICRKTPVVEAFLFGYFIIYCTSKMGLLNPLRLRHLPHFEGQKRERNPLRSEIHVGVCHAFYPMIPDCSVVRPKNRLPIDN